MQNNFSTLLMNWNRTRNEREMPWKGEKNPYRIWLSEVILQQTRVEQGLAYYHRFIDAFPTVQDLALAPDEKVFKCWEGLGYYSRCRNLLSTARYIAFENNGNFPSTYESLLKLKGVGAYTAAAIASFAFDQPFAVLDGNVFRVLSRYFGINTPIDSPEGKKLFTRLAQGLLDFSSPGTFNQAIMDFGAIICKPKQPLCSECVQAPDCQAFRHGFVNQLPVKSKAIQKKKRHFHFFILRYKDNYYIRQRVNADIWKDLHEWVLWESESGLTADPKKLKRALDKLIPGWKGNITTVSAVHRQQLTHQTIEGLFTHVDLEKPLEKSHAYRSIPKKALADLAFPRFITRYLEKHAI
ncbi:A/G-specific adenine glycosylase [Flavihumibacter petaseus]|uniref:Adenine DNA glycosylase n=1 Tax=Flavihumibacter petaseus NBRC 106054 TaxID=1220578 RepID=A0A0E9MVQ5_9BACT|nr:A/G-specific adenine glycosylase [Flavihumibacter petaseus]GAO41837.1 A/G-specific adenine DNA glycosylase [Flavihumibacter petaseus NBRC 106054]